MRWDNLFDDLESQLAQGLGAEEVDLQAEEERLRLGRLRLRDRLVSLHEALASDDDYSVRFTLVSGDVIALRPHSFGRDWMSADIVGELARRRQCVLPLSAIASLLLTRHQARASLTVPRAPSAMPALSDRLGLTFLLRDLCRRRSGVEAWVRHGGSSVQVTGTIDRVGHDHFDLAEHEPGSPRRDSAVTAVRVVPLSELLLVRL